MGCRTGGHQFGHPTAGEKKNDIIAKPHPRVLEKEPRESLELKLGKFLDRSLGWSSCKVIFLFRVVNPGLQTIAVNIYQCLRKVCMTPVAKTKLQFGALISYCLPSTTQNRRM